LDLSKACEAERAKIRRTAAGTGSSEIQSPIRRSGPQASVLQSPRSRSNSNLIRISPQSHIRRSHSHIISPISMNGTGNANFTTNFNSVTNYSSNSPVTMLRKPLSPLTSLIRKPFLQNGQKTVISIMPPTQNGIMDLSKRKYWEKPPSLLEIRISVTMNFILVPRSWKKSKKILEFDFYLCDLCFKISPNTLIKKIPKVQKINLCLS